MAVLKAVFINHRLGQILDGILKQSFLRFSLTLVGFVLRVVRFVNISQTNRVVVGNRLVSVGFYSRCLTVVSEEGATRFAVARDVDIKPGSHCAKHR